MTSGTKLAILVGLLLFVGAGIYVAFVAPPAAGERDVNGGVAPRGEGAGGPGVAGSGGSPSAPAVREAVREPARPTQASQRPVSQRSSGQSATNQPAVATDRVSQPPQASPSGVSPLPTQRPETPTVVPERPAGEPNAAANDRQNSSATGSEGEPRVQAPVQQPVVETPRPAASESSPGSPRPATQASGPQPARPVSPNQTTNPATPSTTVGERTHVVASGDTMTVLAERYFGDRNKWQAIAKANPLVDPAAMKVGTRLVIPTLAATNAPASAPPGQPSTQPGVQSTGGSATAANTHEVAAGETLYSIARRHYGSPGMWELIYAANRERIGADPAALKVGMRLTLPPRPATRAAAGESN